MQRHSRVARFSSMPLSTAQLLTIEDTLNRVAAESILAQPGRDDGLVPAFSLLGDLSEQCAGDSAWQARVTAVRGLLEARLDAAQPFDQPTLAALQGLVEWLGGALGVARSAGAAVENASTRGENATAGNPESGDVLMALNLEENRELLTEFYAEAVDHLQQIEAALLALDHEPENPEALNSIFRSFHTIKGNAGFLGLVPMHTLAHEVESLLDLARNRQLTLNAAIITEILGSRDALQALAQQVGTALEKGRLPDEIVPVSHLIAAVKRLAVAGPVSDAPKLGLDLAADRHQLAPLSAAPAESVASALAPVVPIGYSPANEAKPEALTALASSGDGQGVADGAGKKASSATAGAPAGTVNAAAAKSASATVRVNTEKLDSLMDVVGELVIVQSQLLESSRQISGENAALQRNVAQLSRITKELQSTAMSLRMIPIKPTFQKMERLARDLARDFGKKVTFTTEGEDTELDRTVVEEIGDPLVHMVRNALDHGLESPADRIAAGKVDTGTLRLRAYHQGSNIVVELQDDGRGINPDKIYKKAVEKGVIASGAALSREEILALIFAPGFSTAEKVTAVSGRGVGMDVVKRNIEKLRGKIEISSEVGRGSVFKIKLPLTMAIIDGLVVRVGEDRFILPSTSVQMALRPARENISTVHGKGEVLDLRGRFVPIHRLHRRFNIQGEAANPWEGIVVIVETSGKTSALLVDEMVSKQEVVIKNLGAFMQNLPGVAGGAILGDGNIALILDPGSLLNAA
jgi:two-component system chemotaxis sensor kinase CheA